LFLDIRTLGFLTAFIPFILGLIMILYFRSHHAYPGFYRWIISNFCFSTGFFMLQLRGLIPDIFSIVLANLILVYALILIFEGVQLFYDRQGYNIINYALFTVYVCLHLYFTYSSTNINARVMLASVFSGILNFRIGLSLYKNPPARLEKISRGISLIAFTMLLVNIYRFIETALKNQPVDMLGDRMMIWYSLSIVVSITIWTFSYFFLNTTRMELELEDARKSILEIANTDPLTGIANRRRFFEQGEIEFMRSRRQGHPLSFLIFDIDNLKEANDQYGHDKGDEFLRYASRLFQTEIRPFDLVARYGGDEFVFMLPNATESQALEIAERMREKLKRFPLSDGSFLYPIQLSGGISGIRSEDAELERALKRADIALYQAKTQGRDCVLIA
jgi:diguanylate cyclase (GGDEF)-like protein